MSGLVLFDLDLDPKNPVKGIDNLQRYVQDNIHGYPIYSTAVSVDSLYKDTDPQLIELSEPVDYGNLLNIYYIDEVLFARKAVASDPERYANSVALESGKENGRIKCAVKIGYIKKYNPYFSCPVFLSVVPGELTNTIPPNGKIAQKVGDVDSQGNFLFNFHSPFLR